MEMIQAHAWAIAVAITFFSSFIQSLTGFGLSLIATPLFMIIYDPKEVVFILQIISLFVNLIFGVLLRKDIDWKLVLLLVGGSLLGQPAGMAVYRHVSGNTLKLIVGALILVFLIGQRVYRRPIRETTPRTLFVGALSGVLNASISMPGPPLILYMAASNRDKSAIRAASIVYMGLASLIILVSYMASGQDIAIEAQLVAHLAPAIAAGLVAGHVLFPYLSQQWFMRIILVMMVFSALYTMYAAL